MEIFYYKWFITKSKRVNVVLLLSYVIKKKNI